ncbi:MAG: hypothetical protein P9L99_15885 [Candidatus Lernaella stagnicola]|nr:hypothetical protein [Candidatus Lernaella stagnicola]
MTAELSRRLFLVCCLVLLIVGCGGAGEETNDRQIADDDSAEEDGNSLDGPAGAEIDDDNDDDDDNDNDSSPAGFPNIDWAGLENPILARPDRMLKDQAVVYHNGWFHIFASTRFVNGDASENIARQRMYKTRDFRNYEEWWDDDLGYVGSPDVIRMGDRWFMAFWKPLNLNFEEMSRLYYSTSEDLVDWSKDKPLLPGVQPFQRHTHSALAEVDGYVVLGYKHWEQFSITRSVEAALDPYAWLDPVIAYPGGYEDWAENYQFLSIDGAWRMIATSNVTTGKYSSGREPFIYRARNGGVAFPDWQYWEERTHLEVPFEDWNQILHADSAYLCDWREYDGYFYLFYAGANDSASFQGRGHGKIGVARSADLVEWKLPGVNNEGQTPNPGWEEAL